jgi:uncharacterized protein (TIGR01777 family)
MKTSRFTARSRLDVPPEELWAWHVRPGAFDRLNPAWESTHVVERYSRLAEGSRLVLRVRVGPFTRRWEALHRGLVKGREFQDVQERGPFRHWVHTHRFRAADQGGAWLEDDIELVPPLGSLGRLLGAGLLRRRLRRAFTWRHARTRSDLARHRASPGPPLRVAISGAGGLVGSALTAFLTTGGHRVYRLVRREPAEGSDEILFDPVAARIEAGKLEGLDAVVHLAGENIAAGRWTEARKRAIRDSRVLGTRLLCEALAELKSPPPTLVAASAIGYYGDRGEERLEEGSPPGQGFLPEVCRAWEEATGPAERTGIRVVRLRIGVVLSAGGGALPRMILPFRLGLGGPVGRGRQFMSCIALDDLVGAIHFLLRDQRIRGPVNAVGPAPVRNAELTRMLGRLLRVPAFLAVPPALLRLALGEMAEELLLAGNRVTPARLSEAGFVFHYPDLESALRFELGLVRPGEERPELCYRR